MLEIKHKVHIFSGDEFLLGCLKEKKKNIGHNSWVKSHYLFHLLCNLTSKHTHHVPPAKGLQHGNECELRVMRSTKKVIPLSYTHTFIE
mmetsp:Transcript_2534/g.6612  ORF Transcript_2534/g.6612 Transcript_2534/m.6612 type:complete len:89 (-) Transcript_2534:43-309(-)